MAKEFIPTFCAMCISRCGCIATVTDGRLERIDPDPAHPTGGAVCIKAKAAPELVYHPDRLKTPLVRTSPKGFAEPGWVPLSWDEALDRLAGELRAYGPEQTAFAVTTPSGTAMSDSFGWVQRLCNAFGSANLMFATENCNWHKDYSPGLTWGAGIGMPDYERTGCIILWGFNPATTWLAQSTLIRRAQKRGARLIVVDPRRTGLARRADLWLGLMPGTDGALAFGLIHLLLRDEGYDRAFLERHTNAYDPAPGGEGTILDRLREISAEFDPGRVEQLTGIPKASVLEAGRLLRECGPVSFFTWTGTCQQSQATDVARAIHLLYALTGYIDAPGGNVWLSKPPVADISGLGWRDAAMRDSTLGISNRPLGPPGKGWITTVDLHAGITGKGIKPIKALLSFGGNFLVTKPHTTLTEEALRRLPFYAHVDLFENPTNRWADMLLPAASCWEREGLQAGFMISQDAERLVQLRPRVVTPPGDARSDTWIVFALARRLGLAEKFFDGDEEKALAAQLSPTGLTPEILRKNPRGVRLPLETTYHKHLTNGFPTANGKINVWCDALERNGAGGLPGYLAVEPTERYPYILTTGKVVPYCHSQYRNIPSLRRVARQPIAEISQDIAEARDIVGGAPVVIQTETGAIFATSVVAPDLAPRTVWVEYGWWMDQRPVNYNLCIGLDCDVVSGSNAIRGARCQVGHAAMPLVSD